MFSLTQDQTKQAIEVSVLANVPILIQSAGGLGKSSIIKAIADKHNWKVIDIRLSQVQQFDLC